MKKKLMSCILAALALMTYVPGSFGQEVEIKTGAQFTIGSNEFVESLLEVGDNRTSILTRAGLVVDKFRVLNLDGSLNEMSKFEIEIPEVNGKKLKYFWSVKLGKSVYFFTRYFDKKANDMYLYASELDPTTGKFIRHEEAVKVNRKEFRVWSRPFSAVRSVDSTKVLFITEYPTSGGEDASYNFKVVNSDMSEVWAKDITFPVQDRDFTVMDYDVDRSGNIHFTTAIRMSLGEKDDKDSKGFYYLTIYSYFHETGEMKQYDIGFTNEIIRSIDLDINKDDKLIGTGFYSERSFADSYKGFFYIRIDPKSKEVEKTALSPFSTELLTELIGARKAEKGRELPAYEIRESIALPDGGMAVVAEHYVYTYRETTDPNTGAVTTYETWLYGNTIVMFINPDGQMESAGVLKKRQYCTAKNGNATLFQTMGIGTTPGVNELPYYGLAIMQNKGNIHILYNENPKNAERVAAGKKPLSVRQKTAETMLVTFEPGGKVTTTTLFKAKDAEAGYKMPLMPRSSLQYSTSDMIVFGRKGKTLRAARVTIN
jgi:hypothetical protein